MLALYTSTISDIALALSALTSNSSIASKVAFNADIAVPFAVSYSFSAVSAFANAVTVFAYAVPDVIFPSLSNVTIVSTAVVFTALSISSINFCASFCISVYLLFTYSAKAAFAFAFALANSFSVIFDVAFATISLPNFCSRLLIAVSTSPTTVFGVVVEICLAAATSILADAIAAFAVVKPGSTKCIDATTSSYIAILA